MNEHKFDQKGGIYSKARPSYPDKLFSYLTGNGYVGKATVIADIGSGTGKFTQQIGRYSEKVFAVEPNDDMRLIAEKNFADCRNIISVNGSAENTTLSDSSVDFITVAQAFHWFDRKAFKADCRRILRKNGKVLLVWNDRDTDSELIRENYDINRRFCPNFKGPSNGIDFSKEAFADFFEGDFIVVEFGNDLIYDENTFVSRCLSSSYAPNQGDENYNPYVNELRELFEKYSKNSVVPYPYIARCYIGNV